MVVTATNVNAGILSKKKSGRTCIVCNQQMAWSDGHLLTFQNHLNKDGKHKVVIVKTDNCVKKVYENQDLYLKKKSSVWSFDDNKKRVSIKELFKKK